MSPPEFATASHLRCQHPPTQAAIFSCLHDNNFLTRFPSSRECVPNEPFLDAQEKGAAKDQTVPLGVPTEILQDLWIIQLRPQIGNGLHRADPQ